jgi:LysM repeat protein
VTALVITAATAMAPARALAAPATTVRVTTVRVTAGDTLEAIAARTGTSVAALQQANPQVRPEALQVGQLLRLPPPRGLVQVAAGDTLEAIAIRTGTSVAALQQANPQARPEALQIGQWLRLPQGSAAATRDAAPAVVTAAASPGPDPAADPDAQAALLLSPGERRDRATLTLRERSGQLSWRRFGSTLVDWNGWQLHPGGVRITLVQPAVADVGARRSGATAIAVQCSSLRHTWRIDGDWERWSSPGAGSVAQRIVLQLCSNTLDGPAVAIPPPPGDQQGPGQP